MLLLILFSFFFLRCFVVAQFYDLQFIIAATNRPDIIDPAMLRPGRLDKLLYVQLPRASEREAILLKVCKKMPLDADVELGALAARACVEGYSGADLAALAREAGVAALAEMFYQDGVPCDSTAVSDSDAAAAAAAASEGKGKQAGSVNAEGKLVVGLRHFETALGKVQPSVSRAENRKYERLKGSLRRSRSKSISSVAGADGEQDAAGADGGADGAGAAAANADAPADADADDAAAGPGA